MSPYRAFQQARRATFATQLPAAVQRTVRATDDLRSRLRPDWGSGPKPLEETVRQAIAATRELVTELPFPLPPDLRYVRAVGVEADIAGRRASIDEGMVWLELNYQTRLGARGSALVPVQVREGQVVQPSVFLIDGTMRIISPSTVHELVRAGQLHHVPPARPQYSAPQTPAEARAWQEQRTFQGPEPRANPGMFSTAEARDLLRAALQGQGAFDQESGRQAAQRQPATGDMALQHGPAVQVGDRMLVPILFHPDQVVAMSDGNLANAIRSYIQRCGSQQGRYGWGMVAGIRVEELDRKAGFALASFKSSEIAAPQYAADTLRLAARGPGHDGSMLDPAERAEAGEAPDLHVGDRVCTKRKVEIRTRGGSVFELARGACGRVVRDVFGDGLHLAVAFDVYPSGPVTVAASDLRADGHTEAAASSGPGLDQIVAEIEGLRSKGYGPMDVILTTRQRYGERGDQALAQARQRGLLDA
jgi:hypothetical protein